MISAEEVAEAVIEWARAEIAELRAGYPYPVQTDDALPDVVAVVGKWGHVPGDPENFPFAALEQTWLRRFEVTVSICAEQPEGDAGAREVHQQLQAYADTLMGSTLTDSTLGGRVPMTSPRVEADLTEPFDERDSGTRGHFLGMSLVIAEPIEALA